MSHHHRKRSHSSSSSSSEKKKRRQHGNQFHGQMGGHFQGQPQYGGQMGGYGQPQYGGQQMGGYGQGQQMGYGQGQFQGGYGQQYNDRDQMLRNKIDIIYQKYDRDGSGQLDQKQLSMAIGELCQLLNVSPPSTYQQFINMAKQTDTNYDGRISKMEMFNLFKRVMKY